MNEKHIKVLLIEDNPADTRLIREILSQARGTNYDLECVEWLSSEMELHYTKGFDVIILDLGLRGSQGLDMLSILHTKALKMPIVVLTALYDEAQAVMALQLGAQDYLVKGQIEGDLLVRSIRYAMERKRGETAEAEAKANAARVKQLERELRSLERLSGSSQTAVTAQAFGVASLRECTQDTFNELVQRYEDLMDLALEQRAYKVEHNISEELRSMGEQMGFLKAGPRDVVEIHSTVLKRKTAEAAHAKAQAYAEEGRLMVLELMGYLVSYYRNYSLSMGSTSAPEVTTTQTKIKAREEGK